VWGGVVIGGRPARCWIDFAAAGAGLHRAGRLLPGRAAGVGEVRADGVSRKDRGAVDGAGRRDAEGGAGRAEEPGVAATGDRALARSAASRASRLAPCGRRSLTRVRAGAVVGDMRSPLCCNPRPEDRGAGGSLSSDLAERGIRRSQAGAYPPNAAIAPLQKPNGLRGYRGVSVQQN
jgi:hypothetical protein